MVKQDRFAGLTAMLRAIEMHRTARRLILSAALATLALTAGASPAFAATFVTVGITSPAQGATVFGPITVSGTASAKFGVSSVAVAIDSGSFSPASLGSGGSTWTFALDTNTVSNTSHSITARAADSRGHSATSSVSVTVNNTPPNISIGSPQSGVLVSGTFTVSGTASSQAGVASVQVRVDSGAWQASPNTTNWAVSINSTSFADGAHTISAMATDSVGHSTTTSVSVTFSNSPPSVAIGSPASGAIVSGTVTISGTASSLAGVTTVQVMVDTNAPATASGTTSWSTSIDTTTLSNGSHTIAAQATDSLGRTGTTSISVNVSNLIATHQSPWYLKDGTGNVNTVNETMFWDGDTNFNSKLPTGTITVSVNSAIQPNDANPNDTCSLDSKTGFWSCTHVITSADLQFLSVTGWSLHYAFQLQVEYPPTSIFIISYSGDANFAPSSAQAVNT